MSAFALWRRLDTPGHDAALLTRNGSGRSLRGTAVFLHRAEPACISYSVEIDASWRTTRGSVRGFVADRELNHAIRREADGWYLDGILIDGLKHLWDLDFGFTPATNFQQLRRAALGPGQALDLSVAWFDLDSVALIELPQRYERRTEAAYWYEAPTASYEGMLELASNGFVASYPRLWKMET